MELYQVNWEHDVVFGNTDERELTLDLVKPVGVVGKKLPAIIYVHGGGWMSGDKKGVGGEWNASFAPHGFVCININYRLSGEAIFPAALLDVKTAIRWVKEHADHLNIDPMKIGIWGHSSGGHLATLAALTADEKEFTSETSSIAEDVQAVVSLSGPVDLALMGSWHDFPNSPESKFLGVAIQKHLELAEKANPISYIQKEKEKDIPFLIIHGDDDPICPVNQSRLLHQALPHSTYLEIKGADHDMIGGNLEMEDILAIIKGFFTRQFVKGTMNKDDLQHHRVELNRVVQWFIRNSK